MKLLFYRYHSICEPDILTAFQELGIEVKVLEHSDVVAGTENKDSTWNRQIQMVTNALSENPVDAVFSINFFPFVSDVCNIFHIRYISWIVDAPVMELYYKSIRNPWNRVFIFDRILAEEIALFNPGHVFHQPLAAGVRGKDKLFDKQTDRERKRFSHDVTFVGSLYTEKSPYRQAQTFYPEKLRGYLDGLMAIQEQLYGSWLLEEEGVLPDHVVKACAALYPDFYHIPFEHVLTDRVTLAQLYLGNEITARERMHTFQRLSEALPVSLYTGSDTTDLPRVHSMGLANSVTEMPLIFHDSKIVLNLTSKPIRSGIPQRVFDILSCGGFCLSNYQEELLELFRVGEELVVYESIDDLIGKCEYYLNHEAERRDIASAGYEALVNRYSYERVLLKIMTIAFQGE